MSFPGFDPTALAGMTAVAGVACLAVGVFVLLREQASAEGTALFVFSLMGGIWLLAFSSVYLALSPETALFRVRIAYLGVPLIPPAVYHFSMVVLRTGSERKQTIISAWILGLGFVALAMGTDLLLQDIRWYSWGPYPAYGPMGVPFIVFFCGLLGKLLWDLTRAWRLETDGLRRTRLGWMTLGFALAATGVVDFLPKLGFDVPPIGFASILAFLLVGGWTVLRYPLVELSARFASGQVVEAMTDALLVCDLEGRIRLTNRSIGELLGYGPRELDGRSAASLDVPEGSREQRLSHVLQGEHERDREIRVRDVRGRCVDVSLSSSPLLDGRGRTVGTVVILRDIRDRKVLEAQLHQAQKMEAIGRLAAGVAHDFNNLLTALRGHVQFVYDELSDSSALRADLEEADRAAIRAGELTNQLLQFGRAQARSPEIEDPGDVVEAMVQMLRRVIGDQVELLVERDPEAGLVEVDPAHIEQIMLNLVVNAQDALPGGGRISVRVEPERVSPAQAEEILGLPAGEYVSISVEDDGVGMDEQVRARLFEPFFTTKELGKGTGLGLASVYGIVKHNRGHIQVESAVGRGSRFTVRFPKVTEALPVSSSEEEEEVSA